MTFSDYANKFIVNLGLERISELLRLLGNPQEKIKVIHVAGTNGKGSFCAFLGNILSVSGFKTGVYSTPELVDRRERISVNGAIISESALSDIFSRIEMLSALMADKPSPFEIWTAAAYLYFYEQKCDYAVIEVCMGGLTDATNVISAPVLSVITRLSVDHTEYLGSTLPEIAAHKCGIIKNGCPVLTIAQKESAMQVIESTCAEKSAPLNIAPVFPSDPVGMREVLHTSVGDIASALAGVNQAENASLAIAAANLLGISAENIKAGIESAVHKGRFEILSEEPLVIFDGAHNPNGAKSLSASITRYFGDEKFTVIYAAMRDKEIEKILSILAPHAKRFIFTEVPDNPRSASRVELSDIAKKLDLPVAQKLSETDDKILITGSLYLYKKMGL